MLAATFDAGHFTERVEHGKMVFDYTLGAGVDASHNALRVFELAGFPQAVVDEAGRVARRVAGRTDG